jgi:hypothetical protein
MNLNGDEKTIQRLFREMSLEDVVRTPEFARVLEAASRRTAHSLRRIKSMRLAVVVATLIVVALLAVLAVRQRQSETAKSSGEQAILAPAPPSTQQAETVRQKDAPRGVKHRVAKRVRHRPPANELAIDTKSLFAWQSPTASLLKSPGEDFFKSLPRLGDSFENIKTYSPNDWN